MPNYHEKQFAGFGNRQALSEVPGPRDGRCLCEWAWSALVQAEYPVSQGMYLKSRNLLCQVTHVLPRPEAVPDDSMAEAG